MSLSAFALSLLLLSAPPTTPTAWAQATCPPKPAPAQDSNVQMKGRESERAGCLRRAMNRALDRVLLPLEQSRSPRFREWMALQAEHNRWVKDACALVEEGRWLDLESGERSGGTAYGDAAVACEQQQAAARGLFADALARGEPVLLAKGEGAKAASARTRFRQELEAAARRAPVALTAEQQETSPKPLARAELQELVERVTRVEERARELAKRQCALLAKPPKDCAAALAAQLLAPVDPGSEEE